MTAIPVLETLLPVRALETAPYLSICLIARNEGGPHEARFRAMFESVRKRAPTAEIVVVLAGKSHDNTEAIAREYANVVEYTTGPRGDWGDTPAIDDAAWARQLSFDLARGTWVGWIDSDDRWPDPDEAERLLKLNGQWHHEDRGGKVLKSPSDRNPAKLEDALRLLEANGNDVIWCPYLYQRAPDGTALTWQTRERFARRDETMGALRFRWAEAAHEILVPVEGHVQKRAYLSSLLYVHEKDFSPEAVMYNLRRHYEINLASYERGDMNTRRAIYLADAAKTFNPVRREEFLAQALACATGPDERYRALSTMGTHAFEAGLFWDALQHWGAAVYLRPDLPDVWFLAGEHWASIQDHARAVEWLERGIACEFNSAASWVPPRHLQIGYPGLLAAEYLDLAELYLQARAYDAAGECYRKSEALWYRVRDASNVGNDKFDAQAHLLSAKNAREGHDQAQAIRALATYLLANDEPLKAAVLLEAVPWNLKDHPITVDLEVQLALTVRHAIDPEAYAAFYADRVVAGAMATPEEWLDPGSASGRVYWIATTLAQHAPRAQVLDVGCLDGITGIPLLKLCPEITYTGFDICQEAREGLLANLKRYDLKDRAGVVATLPVDEAGWPKEHFDAILWTEVIEHVQNMHSDLCRLRGLLDDGGRLFITTPWGAHDKGHPPPETIYGTERGHRGHLRVVLPHEMYNVLDRAGLRIEELTCKREAFIDQMQVIVRSAPDRLPPVTFVVPAALWDWNAREAKRDGIGASEGTIIHLAEALAHDHDVAVFGPTPCEDVHEFVAYWKREQMRYSLPPRAKDPIIVSRAPSYGIKHLDEAARATCERKFLWLQDIPYPDLNAEVAAGYEKIIAVSNWHKAMLHELHKVPLDKMEVIHNFVLPRHFANPPARNPHRFVYASSPDRGIVRCLELWPRIREALPDAELHLYYGWKGCERLSRDGQAWNWRYERTRRAFEKLRHQPGVIARGMIGHEAFDRELCASSVWLHPAIDVVGQEFSETCCTLAFQARAAGCVPVCAATAALAETAASELTRFVDPNDLDGFAQAAIEAASEPEDARAAMARVALRDHSVEVALAAWKKILA